jgi:acetolactate synthase-1/3 small subunit
MAIHTISVLAENHSGSLSRIAGLFASRGYNITSLTVAETEDQTASRMTLVVDGDESIVEQIVKQLNRCIDVIKVNDYQKDDYVEAELLFVKLDATKSNRHELMTLAQLFNATVASVSPSSITFLLTASSAKIEEFTAFVKPFGIKEIVRSGKVAIGVSKK